MQRKLYISNYTINKQAQHILIEVRELKKTRWSDEERVPIQMNIN